MTLFTPVYGWEYLDEDTDEVTYEYISGEKYLLSIEATLSGVDARVSVIEGLRATGHVTTFADAADRTTQLAAALSAYGVAPQPGARCYLSTPKRHEIYDGVYWVPEIGHVLGTNYFTGNNMSAGTSGSGSAGSEASMTGSWAGSSTGTFDFPAGGLFKLRLNAAVFQNTAFTLNGTVRIRKDTIAGTVLLRYDKAIPPNTSALSQCFEHTAYLKNDTGSPVSLDLYATAQRQAGGGSGNYTLYGDSTNPLVAQVTSLGHVSADAATAAIAVQV